MRTLCLNSTNIVAGTNNSSYTITFPSAFKSVKGDAIGLVSVNMYNSIFNISSALGNNMLTITMPSGATFKTQVLTIPDGFYADSDLNLFLQQQFILLGWYATNGSSNLYFIDILVNSTQYKSQIDCYPLTSTYITTGYTLSTSGSQLLTMPSATYKSPTISWSSTAFGSLLGFSTVPTQSQTATATQSFLSTQTPTIAPQNALVMSCNWINNHMTNPPHVMYSFPINVAIGSLMSFAPNQYLPINIVPNTYNNLTITFTDQNMNPVIMQDPESVIILAIRLQDEK